MVSALDLFRYMATYDTVINNLFDDFLMDLAKSYILPSYFSNVSIFSYANYPKDAKAARTAAEKFRKRLNKAVLSGINGSVLLASKQQQEEIGQYSRFSDEVLDQFRQNVASSFIKNRIEPEHGMKLSTRVWNYAEQTKAEFELGLSQILEDGIKEGTSAEELGRKVRDKLKDPDAMWRRYHVKKVRADGTKVDVVEWRKKVVDDDGNVHFVKQPLDHPGRGVYRSARQNALRMTATEINMAYDYADIMRYQNEPFVLGYHIGLSGHRSDVVKNFHDMCDDLVGDYPKWFMWNGWHPRCKCILTAILCSEEEMRKIQSLPEAEYLAYKSPNLISSMPQCYNDYIEANKERITQSVERGTQPYWVRDNYEDGDLSKGWRVVSEPEVKVIEDPQGKTTEERRAAIEEARRKRHASRNEEDIQRRWDMRYIERWEYSQKKWETDADKLSEDYLRANINSMLVCVNDNGYYPEDTLSKMTEWQLRNAWKRGVTMANLHLDVCSRNAKVIKDTAKEILKKNSSYPVVSRLRLYMENTNDHDAWNLANRIEANEKGVANLKELVKRDVDFSVVSPNMPYQLLPDSKDYPMDGHVLDKRLFDSLDGYVPLQLKKDVGGFCGEIPIRVNLDPVSERGKYHNIQVIYHEFGHAIDQQNNYKTTAIDDLMKEYEKYKKSYVSIDEELGQSYSSSFKHADWRKRREEVMAEMDVIQALTKGKYGRKDIDGHSKRGYWTGKGHKKRHPHTEFVAHMSEYYFLPNEYAKKADPERYEAMRSLFEKSFIKQRRVFSSAEPVVSAVELRARKIAEAAAKRHAARTPEKVQQLRDFAKKHKDDWEKTVKFIEKMTERAINIDEAGALGSELTKAYINRSKYTVEHLRDLAQQIKNIAVEYDLALMDATEIASELYGISDIDLASVTSSSSIKGLKEGIAMLQQKKADLLALSYIDNPIEVAKQYSFKDAVTVNSAVMKKIEDLKVATPPSSFTGTQLEYQAKKLKWEAEEYLGTNKYGAQDKYPTWQVSQNAYYKRLAEVQVLIEFEQMQSALDKLKGYQFSGFQTKKKFQILIESAQKAIDSKNKNEFDTFFLEAEKMKNNSQKKRAAKDSKNGILTDEQCLKLIEEFEKRYDDTMDTLLRPQTRDAWLNLLTDEEKVVLTKYTQTYNYLNEPLRNIPYYGGRTDKDHDLPILTSALSKVKAQQDMVVRRGVGDYPIPELEYNSLSNLQVGDEFIDGAFLSTAVRTDMGFHQRYNLVIVVPKGSEGIYAEPFSHYTGTTPSGVDFDYSGTIWDGIEDAQQMGTEREWIGQRGSKFKVIKKSGNTVYLKMIGQMFDQPKTEEP